MLSILDNSLRAVNFVFLIIVLGLTGSLIHGQRNSHSRVNFGLFTAVFALVTDSFYSIVANFISAFAWPIITIAPVSYTHLDVYKRQFLQGPHSSNRIGPT